MPLDNFLRVPTPENISFQYRIAGPFRRIMAYVADVLLVYTTMIVLFTIIAVLFFLIFVLWLGLGGGAGPGGATLFTNVMGVIASIGRVTTFIVHWFYGAYMESYFNGQTVGKMMLGLRVKSIDGSAIDGAQSTLRNFFRLFDLFPFVSLFLVFGGPFGTWEAFPTCIFGLACMTLSRRYQRLGDLVAGTMVVIEEKKWTHGLASFEDPRVPQLAELLPKGFVVSASLARALSDFVDRRRFLPYQRVAEIAAHLGKPLTEEFGLQADTNHDLLLCALYYKAFIDQHPEENENEQAEPLTQDMDNPFELATPVESVPPGGTQ